MGLSLSAIALLLAPELAQGDERRRLAAEADVFGILYSSPLALLGLGWLVAATDLALVCARWPLLLLLFALQFPFRELTFFLIAQSRKDDPNSVDYQGSLDMIILWSAVFVFGPSALWLAVLWATIALAADWRRLTSARLRLNRVRNWSTELADLTLGALVALALYRSLGGAFPLAGLAWAGVGPAFCAVLLGALLSTALFLPLFACYSYQRRRLEPGIPLLAALRPGLLFALISGLSHLVRAFGILAAGLYVEHGLGAYLFLVAGLLLAALLGHQLSRAAERNRQWSGEMEELERLGRAIVAGPPDASTLPQLLQEHVPAMLPFPGGHVSIQLFAGPGLLHAPPDHPAVPQAAWDWLAKAAEPRAFRPKDLLPWSGLRASTPLALVPIVHSEGGRPLGGICVARAHEQYLPYQDAAPVSDLLPVMQSLASLIASALYGAEAYAQALAHHRVAQELALAGQIQASLLPTSLPELPGWQLAARLEPARETSGDFYDLIPLPGGRLGLVVADVADKGMGAALYMALSRTLIRTFAAGHGTEPHLALAAANRRLLSDASAEMFVTVFYGVLEPGIGMLTYCNAGHNPPYHVCGGSASPLPATGMPLGILEDAAWGVASVQLAPGDVLLLYTDGITEAEDAQGSFYGEARLLEVARRHALSPAGELLEALLADVRVFAGQAAQSDDIALVALRRPAGPI